MCSDSAAHAHSRAKVDCVAGQTGLAVCGDVLEAVVALGTGRGVDSAADAKVLWARSRQHSDEQQAENEAFHIGIGLLILEILIYSSKSNGIMGLISNFHFENLNFTALPYG